MNKIILFGLFLLLAAAQIAVPAAMIGRHETVLREGRLYKFRTAPVDPADPFRGRYVALAIDENSGPAAEGVQQWLPDQTVYATLAEDSEGFAHIALVMPTPPDGPDYIRARVIYSADNRVHLRLPIDRYYMNEEMAPQAEIAYREHSRMAEQDAYVTVRVKDGDAQIEGLFVAGTPIEEFVRQQALRQQESAPEAAQE
jgi:uncharacterized membrane-anchored protein